MSTDNNKVLDLLLKFAGLLVGISAFIYSFATKPDRTEVREMINDRSASKVDIEKLNGNIELLKQKLDALKEAINEKGK